MSTEPTAENAREYVWERTRLLARLVLTRQKGTTVSELGGSFDIGVDFLVKCGKRIGKLKIVPLFGVELSGTLEPLKTEHEADRKARTKFKLWSTKAVFLFPIMFMLFSVESDAGYFGWLLEPTITHQGFPKLERVSRIDLKKIDTDTMNIAFDHIQAWYEAMAVITMKEVE